MKDFDSIEAQAQQAKADFETQLEKVKADRMLSAEGKQKRLTDLEAQYRSKTHAAMERAAELLAAERAKVEADLRHAQAVAAQQQRELLGPQLVADFLRSDVANLDGPDIVKAVESAPDDWTRAVLLRAGLSELRKRAVGDALEVSYYRLEKLATDPTASKVQERLLKLQAYENAARTWSPDRELDLRRRYGL